MLDLESILNKFLTIYKYLKNCLEFLFSKIKHREDSAQKILFYAVNVENGKILHFESNLMYNTNIFLIECNKNLK